MKSYKYFRGDELDPGGDAGGGEEVGEDVGDRSQPTQAGAEDEVCQLLMLRMTLRIMLETAHVGAEDEVYSVVDDDDHVEFGVGASSWNRR